MPQFDLSNATGQELRQLLDSSRRRGDAALTYKILQEMAARREAPVERRRFKARRSQAEPQLVAVDLGDPMEAPDDDLPPAPNWRPPPHEPEDAIAARPEPEAEVAEPEPPPPPRPPPQETIRPLTLHDADPEPPHMAPDRSEPSLRLHAQEPLISRPPRRSGLPLIVGFALGISVGIALGWWAGTGREPLSLRPIPAAATPMRTAELAPRPAPVSTPAPSPVPPVEAVADPAGGPLAAELNATPTPAPTPPPPAAPPAASQEPAPEPETAVAETAPSPPPAAPAPRKAEPARSAEATRPAPASACTSQPTPADRAICGDAKLRRLQGELRKAYSEALDAHEDRALLRQHQLEWRDARNTVEDPERLARLYEERIRKLKAATAEARQAH